MTDKSASASLDKSRWGSHFYEWGARPPWLLVLPLDLEEPTVAAAVAQFALAVEAQDAANQRLQVAEHEIENGKVRDAHELAMLMRADPVAAAAGDAPHAYTDAAEAELAAATRIAAAAGSQIKFAYGEVLGSIRGAAPGWGKRLRAQVEKSRMAIAGKAGAIEAEAKRLKTSLGLLEMLERVGNGDDRAAVEKDPTLLAPLTQASHLIGGVVAGLGRQTGEGQP